MPTQDSVIAVRLDDAYVPPRRPQQRRATLVDRRAVTHDIMEFTFAADGSADFLAGQYMLLRYGSLLRPRAYSMSNTANGAGLWQFVIKRVANGAATTWLFDSIRPGDSTELWGPIGRAYLRPEAARPILCVAGGSGLAPMLSIARAHSKSDDTRRIEIQFFYGGREPRDLLPDELLSELSRLPNVKYWSALSLPDQGWTGLRGLIDQVVESRLGSFLKAYEVYFAGPPAMVEAMIRMLARCRVPTDQVHYDSFY
jgi:toluene monooxygenase electron transfer component